MQPNPVDATLAAGNCRFRPDPPDTPAPRAALKNLFLIVLFMGFAAWWLLRVTDWFEDVIAILSLSGVVAWVGILMKAVPESYLKQSQKDFFDNVIGCPRFPFLILVLCVIGASLTLFVGSVEVNIGEGSTDRKVTAATFGEVGEPEFIAPGKSERFVFWTVPGRPRQVSVKVAGYPAAVVSIAPWRCKSLRTPGAFLRPVLVFRPSTKFILNYQQNPLDLKVKYGNQTFDTKIAGNALWFGCEREVSVPAAVQARWFTEVSPQEHILAERFWTAPTPILDGGGNPPLLSANSNVEYEITFPDKPNEPKKFSEPVRAVESEADFPQKVDIKALEEK